MKQELEQKTVKLHNQNVDRLADQLVKGEGMILALPETNTKIRIIEVEAFPKMKVGKRYKDWGIEDLTPGDLWNPPSRRILQSLIVSRDGSGMSACVRLLSAEYWNPLTETFVDRLVVGEQEFRTGREGDIARVFGLKSFERSSLRFLDNTDVLYVVRAGQVYNKRLRQTDTVSEQEASNQLHILIDNN